MSLSITTTAFWQYYSYIYRPNGTQGRFIIECRRMAFPKHSRTYSRPLGLLGCCVACGVVRCGAVCACGVVMWCPRMVPHETHGHEMHAHEVHAHKMHAHEVHGHETHAREMHAHEIYAIRCTPTSYACEMHAREVHAHDACACEIHAHEVHAHEAHAHETHAHQILLSRTYVFAAFGGRWPGVAFLILALSGNLALGPIAPGT